jgi:hypothetical protein
MFILFRKSILFRQFFAAVLVGVLIQAPVPAGAVEALLQSLPAGVHPFQGSLAGSSFELEGIRFSENAPYHVDAMFIQADPEAVKGFSLRQESSRQMRYFLAALAVPEEDLWVNLSPWEPERTIPPILGMTELGQDMLAQDYVLKYITALLMHPDTSSGREFWQRVYARAYAKFGTVDIPVSSISKVWIVPQRAVVAQGKNAEGIGGAVVTQARLNVMVDADYQFMRKISAVPGTEEGLDSLARDILREVIVPVLEQEVNEGEAFARVRQIYKALILAHWFRQHMHAGPVANGYVSRNGIRGIRSADAGAVGQVYAQYRSIYDKGVYNLIREELREAGEEPVARHYVSGGLVFGSDAMATAFEESGTLDMAQESQRFFVSFNLRPRDAADASQALPEELAPAMVLSREQAARIVGSMQNRGFFDVWEQWRDTNHGAFVYQQGVLLERYDIRMMLRNLETECRLAGVELKDYLGDELWTLMQASRERLDQLNVFLSKGAVHTQLPNENFVYNGEAIDTALLSAPGFMRVLENDLYFEPREAARYIANTRKMLQSGQRTIDQRLNRFVSKPQARLTVDDVRGVFNSFIDDNTPLDRSVIEDVFAILRAQGRGFPERMQVVLEGLTAEDRDLSLQERRWGRRYVLEILYNLGKAPDIRAERERLLRLYYQDVYVLTRLTDVALLAILRAVEPEQSEPVDIADQSDLVLLKMTAGYGIDRGRSLLHFSDEHPGYRIALSPSRDIKTYFKDDPKRMLTVFIAAVRHHAILSPEMRDAMAQAINGWWHAGGVALSGEDQIELKQAFTELLSSPEDVADVLLEMLELGRTLESDMIKPGLLGMLLPELADADGMLVETSHTFSLSYHTLYLLKFLEMLPHTNEMTLRKFSPVYADFMRDSRHRLQLRAAILFHDLGKNVAFDTFNRPHPLGGAASVIPETLRFRMNVDHVDENVIRWIVFNHHVLYNRYTQLSTQIRSQLQDIPAREKHYLAGILGPELDATIWDMLVLVSLADGFSYRPYVDMKNRKFAQSLFVYHGALREFASQPLDERRVTERAWLSDQDDARLMEEKFIKLEGYIQTQHPAEQGVDWRGLFETWTANNHMAVWDMICLNEGTIYLYLKTLHVLATSNTPVYVSVTGEMSDYGKMLHITVGVEQDRMGVFRDISGILALLGFNIHRATIADIPYGGKNMVLDSFTVYRLPGSPSLDEWRRVLAKSAGVSGFQAAPSPLGTDIFEFLMYKVLTGSVTIDQLFALPLSVREFRRDEPHVGKDEVAVSWNDGDGYSMMRLDAPDRNGLLYIVSRLFTERFDLDIRFVPVRTREDGIVDMFALSDSGRALSQTTKGQVGELLSSLLVKPVIGPGTLEVLSQARQGETDPAQVFQKGGIDMTGAMMQYALEMTDIPLPSSEAGMFGGRWDLRALRPEVLAGRAGHMAEFVSFLPSSSAVF